MRQDQRGPVTCDDTGHRHAVTITLWTGPAGCENPEETFSLRKG
jgi:hypothetical protein